VDVLTAVTNIPYPSWLVPADNTWQLVAATLVGLMSLPGIAVLYGGLVRKKWIVNTMFMTFMAFSLTLVVWMLWGYNLAFGPAAHLGATGSFWSNLIGHFTPLATAGSEQGQAVSGANSLVPFHFPTATLAYFQFVFAAITPILFLGALVGRLKFKAWCLIVPLWITLVYCVDAKLLWGGGFFAIKGAVDFSGGYVIHLSAGVAAFVGAAILGPRRWQDKENAFPSNLMMVAVGAGILWLGWNGFNGGDPFYAGADAAAAVLNTNVATAVGLITWVFWDMVGTKQKKPTFLGAINGMICGLVAITPSAGWVNGAGAIYVGLIASTIVWFCWNFLSKVRPFSKVDDALGVVYTHGFAGLTGGLLVGIFADPNMVEYGVAGSHYKGAGSFFVDGWFYGHSFHQLWEQFLAALWIIGWTAFATAIIFYFVKFVLGGLREDDATLAIGDLAIHDEEAFPEPTFGEPVESPSHLHSDNV
jgi:Amt family ammonium transporter